MRVQVTIDVTLETPGTAPWGDEHIWEAIADTIDGLTVPCGRAAPESQYLIRVKQIRRGRLSTAELHPNQGISR